MMKWSFAALIIGFGIDLVVGDPHGFPHPVVWIGKLIDTLEHGLRKIFPKTAFGEKVAGATLWIFVVLASSLIPALILWFCHSISPWLRLVVESIMSWQILATKSLRDESMKVYHALESGDIVKSRYAVSMIVGRDTAELDDAGVTRAAVETVAENTSDGIVAPLIFLAIGGAPFGFFYKVVNTMDSMLGYLRYALYNATKYVCLWDPTFSAYLAKKRAEGKHYNVALSHAAKKLVRLIYAMEKFQQPYSSAA